MSYRIVILLFMYFFHIVDDYYLQGWLASAKQKSWWKQNAPDDMYKHDYQMALLCHAFSWSFMIHLPMMLYTIVFGGMFYPLSILGNLFIHMYVDNLKANEHKINLWQDQTIHFAQIFVTWFVWIIN